MFELDPFTASIFGALARWLATLIVGFFVAHHIITVDQTAYFTDEFSHKLIVALPLLAPLAWSVWNKYRGRVKFLTALTSTSEDQVTAKIANGMGTPITGAVLLLACVLGAGAALPGCGPKPYHNAVVANTAVAQAIFTVQDEEIAAHNAGLVTAENHKKYKAQILELLNAGDDLTVALQNWDPSQPPPANIAKAIDQVQQLLTDIHLDSPTLSKVLAAAETLLSVLRGSGVLPSLEVNRG